MAIRVPPFLDLAQPPRDTRAMEERELIYDWNRAGPAFDWSRARVDLNDETLRDGLQSPSVRDPSLEVKKRSEEHTSELQSLAYLVCRLLLEKKKKTADPTSIGQRSAHSS